MPNPLSDLTQQLLDYAARAGADQADAIAVDGTSISIDVRAGALEHADRSEGIDVGLRVMVGQRQACVSSSDIKPDTLREMADRAIAMAKEAPDDPYAGLADPSQLGSARWVGLQWDQLAYTVFFGLIGMAVFLLRIETLENISFWEI
jgi:PmbA protein